MQLIAKITSEGKRKAFLAQQTGIQIKLSGIGLGNGAYTPSESQTRLRNEVVRLPIASSRIDTNSYTLYLHTILEGDTEFWVSEVGVYLDDGTLFAVWSDPSHKIAYKNRGTRLLIGFSLKLSEVPINTIQIIDQGQPLSLYYARELAEFGNAVVNLSNAVLENSFDILQEKEERIEAINQFIEKNNKQHNLIQARQNEALELILANIGFTTSISQMTLENIFKITKERQDKETRFSEINSMIQAVNSYIKTKERDFLETLLSNTNLILTLSNMFIMEKFNNLQEVTT